MIRKIVIGFCFWFLILPGAYAADVARVVIEGNKRIERDAILAVIQSKPKSSMDRSKISQDVRSIYRMGFFKDVQVSFEEASGALTFKVVEKTSIREIVFSGNDEEKTEDLQKEVQTKAFTYLDDNKIREDVARLRKYYDGKGFYLADIASGLTPLPNNEARLTFKIQENKKVVVRRINILGNKVFSDSELKKVMQTKEKGLFSFFTQSGSYREEVLNADRQSLRGYYGHFGYIKARISPARVQLTPDKKSIYITIVVEEGEPYTVGKVLLDGEFIKEKTELEKVISLKGQKLVDTSLIQKDVGELTTIYGDEGYAYANVNILDRYDDEKKIVDITYVLQPGQKVWVEKIKFVGNTSTRDKILRREMQINEGGQYHQTKIRDSRLNIERLSLFEEVRLSTPRGSADDRVDIVVDLKEKPTGTFSIGAGFNTLESFQIIAQVQKRNLFGRGYDVSLDARLGGKTQAFNVRFRDEYFLDSKWGFEVNGFNISRVYTDFDLTSRGGTVGLDYPLYKKGLERIRFGVTYSLIDEDLTDIRTTVEQLFTSGLTSSVTTSLTRDTRNRVFEPTKGSYYRLSEEVAGGGLGGDNDFWKSEFDARWFFPLLDQKPVPLIGDSVFALRLNLGYVGVLSDGERVPLFERYFPGGILSIRGFQLRSLGPTIDVASSTDPGSFTTTEFHVGGNKELIFNAEYIFPIVRAANIKGVFFFDMGNAFDNGESIFTITGQRQSTGFGVRWFSPIGPLRFEWGFPLDRKEDESLVVFDFTIGSIF